ncbi:hypothetical protein [Sphingomonas immobilis]|uniref:Uncharacterized protein n=1 Tax=Sphingomonas immobilis TaxID=3063997 RepID=A0ABT9A4B2_9SPHN|nr:hypothetical protein [Sphingomonas sp. CA1-15]MDO7844055.1 hypothetical protein [Sphingomonas sp. CA1-15]
MRWPLFLLFAIMIAPPASARDLGVPADKGWQHAATGLILMPVIDGLKRTALIDSGDAELDVAAQYGPDEEVTIYLFHPGLPDTALWFDRVETVIRERPVYGGVSPLTPEPIAFKRPGSAVMDSLKRAYAAQHGPLISTAAAMMPLGEWLVAIRVSSKTEDPATLSARLDRIIAGIRFPATAPANWPVAQMRDCATHLTFARAKIVKPDGSQVLLGALAGMVAKDVAKDTQETPKAPEPFCRDRPGSTSFGVYRHDNTTPEYWVALNDAGQAAFVSGGFSALLGKGGFQVTLLTFSGTDVYPNFNKLPEPEQVIAMVGGAPLSRTRGQNVTFGPKALK